jgi:Phage related hypothetical protein (DUF1799)
MEENQDALELFVACLTQWRTSLAGITGLDYRAVDIVARAHDIEIDRRTLGKIRILEHDMMTDMSGKKTAESQKPCRSKDACAMCKKKCSERM